VHNPRLTRRFPRFITCQLPTVRSWLSIISPSLPFRSSPPVTGRRVRGLLLLKIFQGEGHQVGALAAASSLLDLGKEQQA